MTYLTGKRFEYPDGNSAGVKTGVIVSEPFHLRYETPVRVCVAVMWDDGSMEGAIDIELLKVLPEQKEREPDGYVVVCQALPYDDANNYDMILETTIPESSLDNTKERVALVQKSRNPRIAEFYFMEE